MLSIQEFCDRHDACKSGREWALVSCKTMQEVWDTAPFKYLCWVAAQEGVLSDDQLKDYFVFLLELRWLLTVEEMDHAEHLFECLLTKSKPASLVKGEHQTLRTLHHMIASGFRRGMILRAMQREHENFERRVVKMESYLRTLTPNFEE